MTAAIETRALGKRYGKQWALQDCTFSLPAGRIAGLVGPNGAGKTTLMHLLIGLLTPSNGSARVFGLSSTDQLSKVLAKVGFVGQNHPLYSTFTVGDMLKFGRHLNPVWDESLAMQRLEQLDIPLDRPTGKLSGGQQAQVALLLALAKRPDLLILDEPVGSLDPLARHQFLQILMDSVAQDGQTVLISSHQLEDLERVCDTLLLLSHSRLLIAEDIEGMLASHRWLLCHAEGSEHLERQYPIVKTINTAKSSRLLIRVDPQDRQIDTAAGVEKISLEELILAYLSLSREESFVVSLENRSAEIVP